MGHYWIRLQSVDLCRINADIPESFTKPSQEVCTLTEVCLNQEATRIFFSLMYIPWHQLTFLEEAAGLLLPVCCMGNNGNYCIYSGTFLAMPLLPTGAPLDPLARVLPLLRLTGVHQDTMWGGLWPLSDDKVVCQSRQDLNMGLLITTSACWPLIHHIAVGIVTVVLKKKKRIFWVAWTLCWWFESDAKLNILGELVKLVTHDHRIMWCHLSDSRTNSCFRIINRSLFSSSSS